MVRYKENIYYHLHLCLLCIINTQFHVLIFPSILL